MPKSQTIKVKWGKQLGDKSPKSTPGWELSPKMSERKGGSLDSVSDVRGIYPKKRKTLNG